MRNIIFLFLLVIVSCEQPEPQKAELIDLATFTNIIDGKKTEKVQVINFWATWCKPCVEELPAFEKLQDNYADQVEVILISLDDEDKVESLVNPFLEKNNIQSKVQLLTHPYAAEWIPIVDSHWDGAIPVTLIKSSNNKRFYNQTFTYNELEEALEGFL